MEERRRLKAPPTQSWMHYSSRLYFSNTPRPLHTILAFPIRSSRSSAYSTRHPSTSPCASSFIVGTYRPERFLPAVSDIFRMCRASTILRPVLHPYYAPDTDRVTP